MEKETLLEKFLQDKLTETEQHEFNVFLKNDSEFKREAKFQMDVKLAVTANEDEAFMEVLSDFELEAKQEDRKGKFVPTKWLVAASLTLLVGLTYFFTLNQSTDTQELFAKNFKPYRNVTHVITRGETGTDMKNQAFSAYERGDYNEAISLFTKLNNTDKEAYYLFYSANALIQLDRAEEAVPLLKSHLKSQDSLNNKSNWYLAMAYFQLEDINNAKMVLNEVVKNKEYNFLEAKQLLEAL